MKRFKSIGSIVGSGYTKRAPLKLGMRSSFVDSMGIYAGGPPGIRTLNLRIKSCPHPLGRIAKPLNGSVRCILSVSSFLFIGSIIGSRGNWFAITSSNIRAVLDTVVLSILKQLPTLTIFPSYKTCDNIRSLMSLPDISETRQPPPPPATHQHAVKHTTTHGVTKQNLGEY